MTTFGFGLTVLLSTEQVNVTGEFWIGHNFFTDSTSNSAILLGPSASQESQHNIVMGNFPLRQFFNVLLNKSQHLGDKYKDMTKIHVYQNVQD